MINDGGDLISATEPDDHEDVHEEVDDVQVDVQGGKDVFLGTKKSSLFKIQNHSCSYFSSQSTAKQ